MGFGIRRQNRRRKADALRTFTGTVTYTRAAHGDRTDASHDLALGQRVRKSSWLAELENVSVGHGVSLLRWRSGGVKHPHDTPPYPFMPSPTFAHSSQN